MSDPSLHRLPALEALRRTPHVCLAEAVRSANRAVTRRYERQLGDKGANATQASLLMRLYYLGESTMAALAEQMETDRTTMVRAVATARRDGLVEAIAVEAERARRVRLTAKGLAELERLIPRWQAAQDELRAELGDDAWLTLMRGLRRLVELEGVACARGARADEPLASVLAPG